MRFHVVGLPFPSSPACAYEGKVRRFAPMMEALGHEVITYHARDDELDATRSYDPDSLSWRRMNARVTEEIRAAARPDDFVCLIAGRCQQAIAESLPLICVEFGVGYSGTFSPYRVFESYAWMHAVYGAYTNPVDVMAVEGHFYDAVIPNYFDAGQFRTGSPGNYYLFLGRLTERKGYQIAADACERLGARLILAGEGTPPAYGQHVGLVDHQDRADLLAHAKAVFVPTRYLEPFGGVAAEAMLSGAPVITTDFGAFTETVTHGVTGYRCHTMAEFVEAAKRTPDLDRAAIRSHALGRWSLEAVGPQYEAYFERLFGLWRGGWAA